MTDYYLFHSTCWFSVLDFTSNTELGINQNMHKVSDMEFYASINTLELIQNVKELHISNGVLHYVHCLCTNGTYKNVAIAFMKEV